MIFSATWHSIKMGCGCPFCAGKQVSIKNCLNTVNSLLSKEWDYNKNIDINPLNVVAGSHKYAYWICSNCGYSWKATISSRNSGRGCPVCMGKVLTDQNRLSIRYPLISKEWHPAKNKNLLPSDVSYGVPKKVWWLCKECGYEWISSVNNRTHGRSRGCPACAQKQIESKIASQLKKYCIDKYGAVEEYKIIRNPMTNRFLSFDIYIEKMNLFIEVMGDQHFKFYEGFHRNFNDFENMKNRDEIKKRYAKNNGYYLSIDIRKLYTIDKAINFLEDFINIIKNTIITTNPQSKGG
jgi:hypothetical protein